MKAGYVYEIHILRALACLMILMIHVTASFYYIHDENFTTLSLLCNQMTRSGTCLFMMITGFLLFYQVRLREFLLKDFLFSRTSKIFLPFVFWSCFYIYLQYQTGSIQSFQWNIDFFYDILVLGDGFYHLWFMSVMIQFCILFPLLQRIITDTKGWIIALLVSLAVQVWFVTKLIGLDTAYFQWDKAFVFNWIFYFILGGFFAQHWEQIRDWVQKHVKALIMLSLLILAESWWSLQSMGSLSELRLANLVSTPILMLTVVSLYPKMKRFVIMLSGFNYIGRYAMGIYLVHPLLLYFSSQLPTIFWEPYMMLFTYCCFLVVSIFLLKGIQQIPYYQYIVTIPRPRVK